MLTKSSVASRKSLLCFGSALSVLSAFSILGILSAGSLLSIDSGSSSPILNRSGAAETSRITTEENVS